MRQTNRVRHGASQETYWAAAANAQRQNSPHLSGLLTEAALTINFRASGKQNLKASNAMFSFMLETYVKTVGDNAFGVVCQAEAVYASNFGVDAKEVLQSFGRMFPLGVLYVTVEPSAFANKAVSIMRGIQEGKGAGEPVPLALDRFPSYTQRVLKAVSRIPVGFVASYGGVADAVGGGARAVGNAMATNCFAPLVPCHRVVTASLGLGGYGGGLRVKFELLQRERRGFTEPKDIGVEGGVLKVFPVELVLEKLKKLMLENNYTREQNDQN
jgi:methylated-DNA-[protein]-cysteine S-methyltransferase